MVSGKYWTYHGINRKPIETSLYVMSCVACGTPSLHEFRADLRLHLVKFISQSRGIESATKISMIWTHDFGQIWPRFESIDIYRVSERTSNWVSPRFKTRFSFHVYVVSWLYTFGCVRIHEARLTLISDTPRLPRTIFSRQAWRARFS